MVKKQRLRRKASSILPARAAVKRTEVLHTITNSSDETQDIARRLAGAMRSGDIVCLVGDLGAGKTTFVQSMTGVWGIADEVRSPSYTLVNEYRGARFPVYHIDLYRMHDVESEEIGLDEYLYGSGVTMIEWADRIHVSSDAMRTVWRVNLVWRDDHQRDVCIEAEGSRAGVQI